jgi:D-alanine-D-alanine ligase
MHLNKNIAILAGGNSSEASVSFKSAALVERHIKSKFNTFVIKIHNNDWFFEKGGRTYQIDKNDFTLIFEDSKITFDLAFIAIHGTPGEDGKLQGYFDILGIPYSTSSLLASSLSFNKGVCNDYLNSHGVNVAQSVQLFKSLDYNVEHIIDTLGLPCFVKPNQSGSSYGISKVYSSDELPKAISEAFRYDQQVLIESFLNGREVTCGVHNFDESITAMPITEIITEHDFFDFDAKYNGASNEITPADLSNELTNKVQNSAKEIYQLLNLNGVARIDFIIQNNIPYMIEANTVPGLSTESLIPQQAVAMGYSLPDFFESWINHFIK